MMLTETDAETDALVAAARARLCCLAADIASGRINLTDLRDVAAASAELRRIEAELG